MKLDKGGVGVVVWGRDRWKGEKREVWRYKREGSVSEWTREWEATANINYSPDDRVIFRTIKWRAKVFSLALKFLSTPDPPLAYCFSHHPFNSWHTMKTKTSFWQIGRRAGRRKGGKNNHWRARQFRRLF